MGIKHISKATKGERVFDILNILFMLLVCFATLYPFWNILMISLNDGLDASINAVTFLPKKFTMDNYVSVFKDSRIFASFRFTVFMTFVNTTLSVIVTSTCAYALSKKYLPGRKALTLILWIAGWFSGGLIPTFIMFRYYGLLNNFWVFIVPSLFSFYHFLIMRTYFSDIPQSIEESAFIDGASTTKVFVSIIIPMSLPIFATIALFEAVASWNNWRTSLIFAFRAEHLRTLQYFLNRLLQESEDIQRMIEQAREYGYGAEELEQRLTITPQSIRAAVTMVATIPIVIVYPFIQKYFVKGVRIGAVKG